MNINRTVERFLRDSEMPATKFGRLAACDPRLVLDMRMGREIGPAMNKKILAFISSYREKASQP